MRPGLPSGPLGDHQGSRGTRPGGLPGLARASRSMWGLCLVRTRKALAPMPLLCRPGVALEGGGQAGSFGTPGVLVLPAWVCPDQPSQRVTIWVSRQGTSHYRWRLWSQGGWGDRLVTSSTPEQGSSTSVATWKGHVPADHSKPTSFPDRGSTLVECSGGVPLTIA